MGMRAFGKSCPWLLCCWGWGVAVSRQAWAGSCGCWLLAECRADFANQVPPRLTLRAFGDRDVWISEFPRPQHSRLTAAFYGFETLKKKRVGLGLVFFLSPKCIFLGFAINYNCGLVWSLPFSLRVQCGGRVSAVCVSSPAAVAKPWDYCGSSLQQQAGTWS